MTVVLCVLRFAVALASSASTTYSGVRVSVVVKRGLGLMRWCHMDEGSGLGSADEAGCTKHAALQPHWLTGSPKST